MIESLLAISVLLNVFLFLLLVTMAKRGVFMYNSLGEIRKLMSDTLAQSKEYNQK